jgi:hypothetical protein
MGNAANNHRQIIAAPALGGFAPKNVPHDGQYFCGPLALTHWFSKHFCRRNPAQKPLLRVGISRTMRTWDNIHVRGCSIVVILTITL